MTFRDKSVMYFWLPLVGFFLFNLIFKVIWVGDVPISMDEPFSIFNAQRPLGEMLDYLSSFNNPPLHEIILHYWIKLGGVEASWVRLPQVIYTAMSASMVFLIGRNSSLRTGILAAVIFSASNIHTAFAHDARAYPLFVLLTLVSCYAFLINLKGLKWSHLFIMGLANLGLIYNHYFGFFVIFAQTGFLLLHFKSLKTPLKHYLLQGVGLFVCYLPMLFVAFARTTDSSGGTWVNRPGIDALYDVLRKFSNKPVFAVIFLVVIVAGGVFQYRKREALTMTMRFHLFLFLSCYLGMFMLSMAVPMFLPRYVMFVSPAFYLLIANAIQYLPFREWATYMLIFCYPFTSQDCPDHGRRPDQVAAFIQQEKTEDTAVIFSPFWINLNVMYHYNREWFTDERYEQLILDNGFYAEHRLEELRPIIDGSKRVILVQLGSNHVDPGQSVHGYLKERYSVTEVRDDFGGATVTVFK